MFAEAVLDVARELERVCQTAEVIFEETFFETVRIVDWILDSLDEAVRAWDAWRLGRRAVREELEIHQDA